MIEGKAAIDANDVRVLHCTREPGVAICGAATSAYALHWDTRTFIHCGACIQGVLAARHSSPEGT